MKKTKLYLLGLIAGAALTAAGCAAQKHVLPDFSAQEIPAGMYQQKVDSFMVVLDSSSSLDEGYQTATEFDWAKGIVSRMNSTLPKNINLNSSLTTYGHSTTLSNKTVLTQYDLGKYDQEKYQSALDAVPVPGGTSRMDLALSELKSASGRTALIVVSDGDVAPVETLAALKKLVDQYGDRLCVYTVQVGDSAVGKKTLEEMAKTGKCGKMVLAKDVASGAGMNGFVKTVFFEDYKDSDGDGVTDNKDQCPGTPKGIKVDAVGCPLDSDGDGVTDDKDQCPGTPKGVKVDAVGCPLVLDSDGDGVIDDKDKCPNTPKGVIVDQDGCPIAKVTAKGTYIFEGIQFDTAKWSFKPQSYEAMDKIVTAMNANPGLKVEIQGHTDNRGSAAYNQQLSEKRAQAVMEYLTGKGISPARMTSKGYGLGMPVDTNDTEVGRAANRRVELKPIQ